MLLMHCFVHTVQFKKSLIQSNSCRITQKLQTCICFWWAIMFTISIDSVGDCCLKVGTHEATNRCNTLLQRTALCVQSSNKSYALIAAMGYSDKSPVVNTSTFGGKSTKILSPSQNFVAATCHTKLNQFYFVRHVAATKFCRDNKIFDKILLFTR